VRSRIAATAQASPSFHYGSRARRRASKGSAELPPKVGSFQLFVKGYRDSAAFLRSLNGQPPPENVGRQLRQQFEALVVLDYIIRNTGAAAARAARSHPPRRSRMPASFAPAPPYCAAADRGSDNWMIKLDEGGAPSAPAAAAVPPVPGAGVGAAARSAAGEAATDEHGNVVPAAAPSATDQRTATGDSWVDVEGPRLYIAAIDNGLSFPFKHPDNWRTYPFGWSHLPLARVPFSAETAERLLPLISDADFVAALVEELRRVMELDEAFDEHMFQRQMAVRAPSGPPLPRRERTAPLTRRPAAAPRGLAAGGAADR